MKIVALNKPFPLTHFWVSEFNLCVKNTLYIVPVLTSMQRNADRFAVQSYDSVALWDPAFTRSVLGEYWVIWVWPVFYLSSTWLDSPFSCSAFCPSVLAFQSMMGKSSLYDCPLLDCQFPWFDSLFLNLVAGCPLGQLQLLGLSITLVWSLSHLMEVILCPNIPAFPPLVWHQLLGLENCLVFSNTFEPSLPLRVTLRRGMERKIESYCQFIQALKVYLNMAPPGFVRPVEFHGHFNLTNGKIQLV